MKVLLAIDGSRHSDAAVAEVARRPWPAGTEVKILTVIHPTVPVFPIRRLRSRPFTWNRRKNCDTKRRCCWALRAHRFDTAHRM